MLVVGGLFVSCVTTAAIAQTTEGDIESRGMPQTQKPIQPGMPVQPGAPAQQKLQLPTWPQTFDIEDHQPASFGLAFTQPGPLVVDVQWQGPPLEATLRGPSAQPIAQRGQGQIRLTYQVTPQDVQRGVLWVVNLAMLPNTQGRATGHVTVQHPPVNEAQAEAAVRTRVGQAKQQSQLDPAKIQASRQALFLARKAESDRQYQEFIKGTTLKLDGFLKQKGLQGQIRSRALKPPPELNTNQQRSQLLQGLIQAPRIDSLTVTQGPPGTVVGIQGAGFSDVVGRVIMTAPRDQRIDATVMTSNAAPIWTDTFIAVKVPEVPKVTPFTANFSVLPGTTPSGATSNQVPFQFIPRREVRIITRVTGDYRLSGLGSYGSGQGGGASQAFVINNEIHHARFDVLIPFWFTNIFQGTKGNDWFFENTMLKNGWKFDCVEVIPYDFHACRPGESTVYGASDWAGAYVVAGLGSASPKFAVRWWLEAFNPGMAYTYAFAISGPEGTPDGIEVP
jgi:hypothetical protein